MKGKLFRKIKSYLILHYIPTQWLYKYFVEGDYDYEIAFLEGLPTKIIGCSKSDSVKYAWLHTNLINNFDSLSVFKNEKEYRFTGRAWRWQNVCGKTFGVFYYGL